MSISNTHRELRERELLSRPVAGLQYMLEKLAGADPELTRVAVDGVFGERTLEAVLRFQKKAGLPMTGRADPATWEALRARWRELEGRAGPTRPVRVFPAEGTRVEAGAAREYLILPQTMFRVLARRLPVRSGFRHCLLLPLYEGGPQEPPLGRPGPLRPVQGACVPRPVRCAGHEGLLPHGGAGYPA